MKRVILLSLTGLLLTFAADNNPKPITQENREAYKDLRITAFQALASYQEAAKREAQAKLDEENAQIALNKANNAMTEMVHKFQLVSNAPADSWCLSPTLEWTAKPKDKPCPSW